METRTLQEQVKVYKGKLSDEAHQKYQEDLKKMSEQGWHMISWCEVGKDFFGRVMLRVTYSR